MEKIEIKPKKAKLIALLVFALVFAGLGVFLVLLPQMKESMSLMKRYFCYFAGAAAILFFGLAFISVLRKMLSTSFGLTITDEGITDNSSASSLGFIPWKMITGVRETMMNHRRILCVMIHAPEQLIEIQKSSAKRFVLNQNFRLTGTPFIITTSTLDCDFDMLKRALEHRLALIQSNTPLA